MRKEKQGFTIIIVAILIIALVLAGYLIVSQGKKNTDSNLGTETIQVVNGTGQGFNGEIKATVSYEFGKIIDLYLVGENETPSVGGAAMESLKQQILQNGSTNDVDVVTGATYTSHGVFDAISDATSKLILRQQ